MYHNNQQYSEFTTKSINQKTIKNNASIFPVGIETHESIC